MYQELQDTGWPGDPPQVILFILQALASLKRKERCDHTVNVNVFFTRVCWPWPSQAGGSEWQHHRVPFKECGPRHRVCPDSLRTVWICGGTWSVCNLQNLWASMQTHLTYIESFIHSHTRNKELDQFKVDRLSFTFTFAGIKCAVICCLTHIKLIKNRRK